jgi:tetratricopeptide (TPR) repeat protein
MLTAATLAWSQPEFRGDEALALAGAEWEGATQDLAAARLRAVLEHLRVGHERAARHGDLAQLKFIKAEKFLELGELSDAVVIARQGAKIVTAKNLTVIAGGPVEISFAATVFAVASGPIRIGHELPDATYGGIYVTRASVSLGHARNPILYAAGGARASFTTAVTAYNTEFKDAHIPISTALPGRLFRDEPVRGPEPRTIQVLGSQPVTFTGSRCRAGLKIQVLEQELRAALRREPACDRTDSASVRCEKDDGVTPVGVSVERWSFEACGRKLEAVSTSNAYTRSVVLGRGGASAPGRYGALARPSKAASPRVGGDAQREITRLFAEARGHTMKGEIVDARARYAEVLAIAPDHAPALTNIESLDQRVARADAAAAPFSTLIAAGKRDPRVYADRGLAYLGAGDVGRGLADLDAAAERAPSDTRILLERADAYLRADRAGEAGRIASGIIARFPRLARGYELRAWSNLIANQREAALSDARSSLAEEAPWTRDSFARQKAGYRVLAGYFALLQTTSPDRAAAWLGEWRKQMSPSAWPDAFGLYVLGELEADRMRQVASSLKELDRGNALGEAAAFDVLATHLRAGTTAETRSSMTRFFREGYGAGYSLGLVLYRTQVVPGRLIKRREEF